MSALTENYSGIVIDQNALQASTSGSPFSQTFTLPADYVRGATATILPDLTGFQVYADVLNSTICSLDWNLQVDDPLNGLQTIASGTNTGAVRTGLTWFGVIFEDTVPISPSWLTATFTLNITSLTCLDLGYSDGPVLMYRILAAIADSGTDFLGNVYRSAAINTVATNIGIFESPDIYAHWMSNPCPSKFGVEALYMDVRQAGEGIVIDRLTVDPMTPGIFFHIYYSNDPTGPGTNSESWETLLWTPVYQTYQVSRMQTFALPDPILAKYICIEFTNLQARHYRAGNFQLPSIYKKYPKWVLDYFLSQFKTQGVDRLSSNVNITYDALDLAYSYYSTDIIQQPDPPLLSQTPVSPLNPFVNENLSNLDPKTLSKISLDFQPYLTQPALLGDGSSMLSDFGAANAFRTYTTEVINRAIGDTNTVSNVQRDALLIEKAFPAMFFYLPSRHTFRIAQANFDTDVAYFAGVKQLVLHRDVYTSYGNQAQYNEIIGDGTNLVINDFIQADALPPLPPPPPPPPPTCTSYLWWTEYGPNSTLSEANGDGTGIQPNLINPSTPAFIAQVANDDTYIYWTSDYDLFAGWTDDFSHDYFADNTYTLLTGVEGVDFTVSIDDLSVKQVEWLDERASRLISKSQIHIIDVANLDQVSMGVMSTDQSVFVKGTLHGPDATPANQGEVEYTTAASVSENAVATLDFPSSGAVTVTVYVTYNKVTLEVSPSSGTSSVSIPIASSDLASLETSTLYPFVSLEGRSFTGGGSNVDVSLLYLTPPLGAIGRAALDGSNVIEQFITLFIYRATIIAVSPDHIFYGTDAAHIGRANIDGTDADDTWQTFGGSVENLAADSTWLYATVGLALLRIDPATGSNTTLIAGDFALMVGVNSAAIVFLDILSGDIMTAALDGTGATTLIPGAEVGSAENLAVSDWYVYWTLFGGAGIKRAAIDGSGVTTLISGADVATVSGLTIKDCPPPVPLLSPSLIV